MMVCYLFFSYFLCLQKVHQDSMPQLARILNLPLEIRRSVYVQSILVITFSKHGECADNVLVDVCAFKYELDNFFCEQNESFKMIWYSLGIHAARPGTRLFWAMFSNKIDNILTLYHVKRIRSPFCVSTSTTGVARSSKMPKMEKIAWWPHWGGRKKILKILEKFWDRGDYTVPSL